MKLAKLGLLLTFILCGALLTTACAPYPSYDRGYYSYGHGYRDYPYRDRYSSYYYRPDLRYDNRLGVYVVVGMPYHYYYDDRYYRYWDDRWYSSAQLSGGWRYTNRLPRGLARRYGRI